jgi:hypothetical protein
MARWTTLRERTIRHQNMITKFAEVKLSPRPIAFVEYSRRILELVGKILDENKGESTA